MPDKKPEMKLDMSPEISPETKPGETPQEPEAKSLNEDLQGDLTGDLQGDLTPEMKADLQPEMTGAAEPEDCGSPQSFQEIEWAHDLLTAMLGACGKVTGVFDPEEGFPSSEAQRTRDITRASRNVLCWVLGHKSTGFEGMLRSFEKILVDHKEQIMALANETVASKGLNLVKTTESIQ